MVAMRPIVRWCAAFVAPGTGGHGGSTWRGLWPVAAHLLGLIAVVVAVKVGNLFPPTALVLWVCYQSILATHVARGAVVGPGWVRYCQVFMLLGVVYLLLAGRDIVQLPGDSGLPLVRPSEWLLLEAAEETPRLGDLLVIRCEWGSHITLGRVVGLPGDHLFREGLSICRNDGCYPTAAMVLEGDSGEQVPAATEVVGGRGYVLLPASGDVGIEWKKALPVEVPAGSLALLPDNRASASFAECTLSNIVLPVSSVEGRPVAIVGAGDWSRFGLLLQ